MVAGVRYAAEYKDLDEPLRDFINAKVASTNARRGLLDALGEVAKWRSR